MDGLRPIASRLQPVFFIAYDDLMHAIHTVGQKYPHDTNAWGTRTRRELLNLVGYAFDRSPYKMLGREGGQSLIPMSELSDYIEIHRTPKCNAFANNALVYLMDLVCRYGGTGLRVGLYFDGDRTIVSPKYRIPSEEYPFDRITSAELFADASETY